MTWWPELEKFLFALLAAIFIYLLTRDRARQTEIGRLHGRVLELESIKAEAAGIGAATESGRLDARDQKLDLILQELTSVTRAQKEIEVKLSGGEWDRQWLHTERIKRFAEYLTAIHRVVIAARPALVAIKYKKDIVEFARSIGEANDGFADAQIFIDLLGSSDLKQKSNVVYDLVGKLSFAIGAEDLGKADAVWVELLEARARWVECFRAELGIDD